jgi:hypothetical protein
MVITKKKKRRGLSTRRWGRFNRGVMEPWLEADHSLPSSVEVKNYGAILPYVFTA